MEEICCLRCHRMNRAGALYCAACSLPLQEGCPECGHVCPPQDRYCDACGADLHRSDKTSASSPELVVRPGLAEEPERRQVTAMFCDLVGSTPLSRQLDPEDLRVIIRAYQDVCAGEIARFGGYIARYAGDGILVFFGYPQAYEDAAVRAARSALGILRRVPRISATEPRCQVPLACRIGIATGIVVVGDVIGEHASQERAIVGETPNLASRLQGLASPNTALVSASTCHLIKSEISCRCIGRHPLKGYSEPVEVYLVENLTGQEANADVKYVSFASPFVGRTQELALLNRRWQQACRGSGRLLFVQGDPGIGKSRLVKELRASLSRDSAHCLEIVCSPLHSGSALYPVAELLKRRLDVSDTDSVAVATAKLRDRLGATALTEPGSSRISDEKLQSLVALLLSEQSNPEAVRPVASRRSSSESYAAILSVLLSLTKERPLLLYR